MIRHAVARPVNELDPADVVRHGVALLVPALEVEQPRARADRFALEVGRDVELDRFGMHELEPDDRVHRSLYLVAERERVPVPYREGLGIACGHGQARRRVGQRELAGGHVDGCQGRHLVGSGHGTQLVPVLLAGRGRLVDVGEPVCEPQRQAAVGEGGEDRVLGPRQPAGDRVAWIDGPRRRFRDQRGEVVGVELVSAHLGHGVAVGEVRAVLRVRHDREGLLRLYCGEGVGEAPPVGGAAGDESLEFGAGAHHRDRLPPV